MIDAAAEPLRARHVEEAAAVQARIEQYGERGSGRKELEDRHKRELRRHRADELRFGLATLAARYRDAAAASPRPGPMIEATTVIHAAAEALIRNPNEMLLLHALLLRLPAL
jgi:DNA polymerase-3 subunit delta'